MSTTRRRTAAASPRSDPALSGLGEIMSQLGPFAALSRGSVTAAILGFGENRSKLEPAPALSAGPIVVPDCGERGVKLGLDPMAPD